MRKDPRGGIKHEGPRTTTTVLAPEPRDVLPPQPLRPGPHHHPAAALVKCRDDAELPLETPPATERTLQHLGPAEPHLALLLFQQFPSLRFAPLLGFLLQGCLGVLTGGGSICGDMVGLDLEILLLLGVIVEAWECRRHDSGVMSNFSEPVEWKLILQVE